MAARRRSLMPAALVVALALATAAACTSFSDSSESISKIVSSPITSFSESSSPEDEVAADVRDFTSAHFMSGGDADELRRAIADLAKRNGVTDWEASRSVWSGIGGGLADAKLEPVQIEAFQGNLHATDEQAAWLQQGYDTAKN